MLIRSLTYGDIHLVCCYDKNYVKYLIVILLYHHLLLGTLSMILLMPLFFMNLNYSGAKVYQEDFETW